LGELNYSPALFNLGVWYELRAAACSDADSAVKMKYQSKAEERYKQAVLTDNHPIAAYNLACLLLRTGRREVQVGDHKESVTHLMQIAADSGVELKCISTIFRPAVVSVSILRDDFTTNIGGVVTDFRQAIRSIVFYSHFTCYSSPWCHVLNKSLTLVEVSPSG
uniref:TPR_REGION domain-containing protein n=1 Tax=Echinostoma caproni TaxID=27848 RepID=A0A183AJ07_9TREM